MDRGADAGISPQPAASWSSESELTGQSITWADFQETVLPGAERIELFIPEGQKSYGALLTAVDPTAQLVFKWDNAFSPYDWAGGSTPTQWGLPPNAWVDVSTITLKPHLWTDPPGHGSAGALLVLDGCADRRRPSLGLYPVLVRSELRPFRRVIEERSQGRTPTVPEGPLACGLWLDAQWGHRVCVTSHGIRRHYVLDRWD